MDRINQRWVLISMTAMVVAVGAFTSTAQATWIVNMSEGGTFVIGQVQNRARAVFKPSAGGGCRLIDLAGVDGGLNDHLAFFGSESTDVLQVAAGPTNFCNFEVTPLVTNGFSIRAEMRGGNDIVLNDTIQRMRVYGGWGADRLMNMTFDFNFETYGGGDDDFFFMGDNGLSFGEGGNDFFCTAPGQQGFLVGSGGPDFDTGCGPTLLWDTTENIPPNCSCSLF